MFTVVAIPILAGAALRIPMGMLADHIGPKRTGQLGQLVAMTGLAYAWFAGLHSKLEVELLGLILGVAGASFAVALPQASRWYPPKYQGIVRASPAPAIPAWCWRRCSCLRWPRRSVCSRCSA